MDKNLRNCKLSNEEIISIWTEIPFEENSFDYEEELLEAQLEKLKAYIEEQKDEAVKAERERILKMLDQFHRGDIDEDFQYHAGGYLITEQKMVKLKEEVNK